MVFFQNLAFGSRVGPKVPQKCWKRYLKWHPCWCCWGTFVDFLVTNRIFSKQIVFFANKLIFRQTNSICWKQNVFFEKQIIFFINKSFPLKTNRVFENKSVCKMDLTSEELNPKIRIYFLLHFTCIYRVLVILGDVLKSQKHQEIAYFSGRMQENAMLLNRIFWKIVPNPYVLRGFFATPFLTFFVKNNVFFSKIQKKVKKKHFLSETMCFTRVFFRI